MRALFASHTAKLTGSAVSLFTLVSGLDRARFAPEVLLAETGPLGAWLDAAGIPWRVIPYRGWTKALTAPRAYARLRSGGFGVAHVNCAVGFSRAVARAAAWAGVPVVWHVREPPDGSRVRHNRAALMRHARRIVVVSEDLERALAGGPPVDLVDNGVDLRRFHPAVSGADFRRAHGVPADAFVFGIIGTVEERKNTLLFLDAAERIAREAPGVRCLVVGAGPEDYVAAARGRVAASDALRGRVVFTGPVEDAPAAMAACDAVVMPSAWEGFPRVLVESMCVGRPVIASAVGAVPRILEDGRTGFVVPPGDLDATLAAMRAALADPARLREIGLRAAAEAQRRFSQQAHVARMSEILAAAARP